MEKIEDGDTKPKVHLLGDTHGSPVIEKAKENVLKNVTLLLEPECKTPKCRLWIVFIGCCVLHFMVFGMHYSFGVMFQNLLTTFNAGQGQTGRSFSRFMAHERGTPTQLMYYSFEKAHT